MELVLLLPHLLRGQRDDYVRVQLLLILLHHFQLDVDRLRDPIEHHVVVEFKLLVEIVFVFELVEGLGRALQIIELSLERQVGMLDHLMDQGSFFGERSGTFLVISRADRPLVLWLFIRACGALNRRWNFTTALFVPE